jgi:hypothetical protein
MRVLCNFEKSATFKSQGGFAISNASLSYCSRFGGRPRVAGPEQTIEESNMPVTAKKKAVKKKAKKVVKKKTAKKKKKK